MAARRESLARRRAAMGFTQESLAEHLGLERSTVGRWERGTGTPQPWNQPDLAKALDLTHDALAEVLGPDPTHDAPTVDPLSRRSAIGYGLAAAATAVLPPDDAIQLHRSTAPTISLVPPLPASWAAATYDAVLNPVDAAYRASACLEDDKVDVHALRPVIDRAMRVSLLSDYGTLQRALPGLIGQVEVATQVSGSDRDAQAALSDVYAVVGWTLIKADSPVGAWIAAQRSLRAAELADDALRIAAATRCLAEAHMRAGHFEEATRTAFLAAVHLDSVTSNDRLAVFSIRGAALLSAAAASARRHDRREALAALKAAAACATELEQDRADLATVFGPTNVAIHQVAVAVELGDARTAVSHIPSVRLERMPKALTERRARFLIDAARSYAQVGDCRAATDALLDAERFSADEVRNHRLTRELTPRLAAREPRTSEIHTFAGRCNVPV